MYRDIVQGCRIKSTCIEQLKSRSLDSCMASDRRSPLPSLQRLAHNQINVSLLCKLLLFGPECQYDVEAKHNQPKKGVTMNPATDPTTEDEVSVEALIEDVSIDGMCGVY
jgi:mycofactocin precursor